MLALSKPSRAITRTVLSISIAAVSFTHSTKWSPPLQFPHSKCYFESKKYCKSRRNRILILHYDRFHGQPELCCCILIRIFAEFTTLFMVIIPCETPKINRTGKNSSFFSMARLWFFVVLPWFAAIGRSFRRAKALNAVKILVRRPGVHYFALK